MDEKSMTTGKSPGKRDDTRERRITDEIIVDAYDPEEKAMGWYYYLERPTATSANARHRS